MKRCRREEEQRGRQTQKRDPWPPWGADESEAGKVMKLIDRIIAELQFVGLHDYPVAQRIAAIVKESHRPWRRFYLVSIFVAFLLGAALDYTWHGVQITAIQENLAAWRHEYEAEHKVHHAAEMKPVGKAAAHAIVGRLDREREGRP